MKLDAYWKRFGAGNIDGLSPFWDMTTYLLYNIIEGKCWERLLMVGKGRSWYSCCMMHDMMEGRDYGQLKDLISDRWRWRQDSQGECMSETCWKQQKTKDEKELNSTDWTKVKSEVLVSQVTSQGKWRVIWAVSRWWRPHVMCNRIPSCKPATNGLGSQSNV